METQHSFTQPETPDLWQQGSLLDLTITDLNHEGAGVGRWQNRVVFVPETVVGDRLQARLVHVKPTYAHGKLYQLLEPSPHRIRPRCIVADKCGGCQWQHIDYAFQQDTKRNQVIQNLQRIGGFSYPPVDPLLSVPSGPSTLSEAEGRGQGAEGKTNPHTPHPTPHTPIHSLTHPLPHPSTPSPIHRSAERSRRSPSTPSPIPPSDLHYRNKATYPLGLSSNGQIQTGYYRKGSHQIVNLNQCPIQDSRLDPLLAEVKQDIQQRGWRVYDEKQHKGILRHLGLRIGRRTGEMLLTLVGRGDRLPGLEEQAIAWCKRYPDLVGVLLNLNPHRTNTIFGPETRLIEGRPYLNEIFSGLTFRIHPTTFFQVNTEQAEALLQVILEELQLNDSETVVDAYCGIGTLTLPIAQRVKGAIALEIQPEAIDQARLNAELNHITNVTFHTGAVETLLPTLEVQPDIVLLDPPRKGCEPVVMETLRRWQPDRIVYVSCNPATLARDLKVLCESELYTLTRVQPADFFPQTTHVECAAFLHRRKAI